MEKSVQPSPEVSLLGRDCRLLLGRESTLRLGPAPYKEPRPHPAVFSLLGGPRGEKLPKSTWARSSKAGLIQGPQLCIFLPVIDTVNQSQRHSRLVSDTPLGPFNHAHHHPGADSPLERQFATLLLELRTGMLGDRRVNKIRQVHKQTNKVVS